MKGRKRRKKSHNERDKEDDGGLKRGYIDLKGKRLSTRRGKKIEIVTLRKRG